MSTAPVGYVAASHTYIDMRTGEERPHITGMLEQTGWVKTGFYTEEGSDRGTVVHSLTEDFDLGVLSREDITREPFGLYALGWVDAMERLRPQHRDPERGAMERGWEQVEVLHLSPRYGFGGKPDRVGLVFGADAVVEIKTGGRDKSHPIQTALQVLLLEHTRPFPPTAWRRLCVYLRPNGRFTIEPHENPRDIEEARRVIAACCP